MTKEDEARLEHVRGFYKPDGPGGVAFLLRLLDEALAERGSWRRVAETLTAERDEQAARVAAPAAAGNALAAVVADDEADKIAPFWAWQAAIRARAETPAVGDLVPVPPGATVVLTREQYEQLLANCAATVAPGEVKP